MVLVFRHFGFGFRICFVISDRLRSSVYVFNLLFRKNKNRCSPYTKSRHAAFRGSNLYAGSDLKLNKLIPEFCKPPGHNINDMHWWYWLPSFVLSLN